jgi:hypothetical protein
MQSETREMMAREAANWFHRGLIDERLLRHLKQRYDSHGAFLSSLLKWLGIFAVVQFAAGILALIAAATQSTAVAAVLLAGVSYAAFWQGRRFALDPAQEHPFTGSVLLTASMGGVFGVSLLLLDAVDNRAPASTISLLAALSGVASLGVAYAYRLRWPLFLGLLTEFHALGSYSSYVGRGSYAADIQDPPTMAAVALLCTVVGVIHERLLEEEGGSLARHVGFGGIYVMLGLFYFNCSLWFQSILNHDAPAWVAAFTVGGVVQLLAGARLKDGRFTGFGVVFLSINLYTRLFENLWNKMEAGWLLLACGLVAAGLGWVFEWQGKRS